jgi:precorrin-4 methylase
MFLEKIHPKQDLERRFDASYIKLTRFLRNKPTREKLEKFMKENPGLIIYVSKEKAEAAHKKLKEYLKKDPAAAQLLKHELPTPKGEEK